VLTRETDITTGRRAPDHKLKLIFEMRILGSSFGFGRRTGQYHHPRLASAWKTPGLASQKTLAPSTWRSYTPTISYGLSPSGRHATSWHVRAEAGRHPEDEYQAAVKRFPADSTLSLKRFALGHA
jgi:hypothetical protein